MHSFKRLLVLISVIAIIISFQILDHTVNSVISTSDIKGVNNPHIWYDWEAYSALDTIKNYGFNAVRIVWSTSGSGERLGEIINKCIGLDLKPIPELHDVTGGQNGSDIDRMVNYWISIKKYIPDDVWINIANEWGPSNSVVWRDAYIKGIKAMRNAGMKNIFVVDAGGWGQDDKDILDYGPSIIRSDSKIVFSIHMYGQWNDNNKIDSFLNDCQSKGLAIMVGEFGYNCNNNKNNLGCKVDAAHLINTCNSKKIGYLAWSWRGNNSENAWLDLTNDDWKTLNYWGNLYRNSANVSLNSKYINSLNVYYRIVNRNSGKCLDVKGASSVNGANVLQWTNSGCANQQWQLIKTDGVYSKLKNRNSGKLLDAEAGNTVDGGNVIQWSDKGSYNQQW
ncbi:MAG: RICIN domain-containing protein, partial [Bacillota bacterium]|nr:RICIN domain-containing protein [Bacillota bacterium]